MNRICIWLLAAASAVCLCMLPRTGTDAAKLLPAQVLVIGAGDGVVTVEADNGAAGSGPTLAAALGKPENIAYFPVRLKNILIKNGFSVFNRVIDEIQKAYVRLVKPVIK